MMQRALDARQRRLQSFCLIVGRGCRREALEPAQDIAPPQPGFRILRHCGTRLLVRAQGLVVVPEGEKDIAPPEPCVSKAGVEGERLIIVRRSRRMRPARKMRIAASKPRLRQVRCEPDRLVKGAERFVVLLERAQGGAPPKPGDGDVRLQRQRPVVGGKRVLVALELPARGSPVDMRLGHGGGERQRPLEASKGRLMLLHRQEDATALVEGSAWSLWRSSSRSNWASASVRRPSLNSAIAEPSRSGRLAPLIASPCRHTSRACVKAPAWVSKVA